MDTFGIIIDVTFDTQIYKEKTSQSWSLFSILERWIWITYCYKFERLNLLRRKSLDFRPSTNTSLEFWGETEMKRKNFKIYWNNLADWFYLALLGSFAKKHFFLSFLQIVSVTNDLWVQMSHQNIDHTLLDHSSDTIDSIACFQSEQRRIMSNNSLSNRIKCIPLIESISLTL